MELNILDLRQQRCPMTLLLAKRHTAQLVTGESVTILISEQSSLKDIESYLRNHNYSCSNSLNEGYYSLKVVKETSLNVRND